MEANLQTEVLKSLSVWVFGGEWRFKVRMTDDFGSTWLKPNVKIIGVNGSDQNKPIQSKTASL